MDNWVNPFENKLPLKQLHKIFIWNKSYDYIKVSVYTLGLDRAKQVTGNKPWITHLEYMLLFTSAFTFIYFEDFQILTKIHYNPYSLYKILKGSKFHNDKYHQISSEF